MNRFIRTLILGSLPLCLSIFFPAAEAADKAEAELFETIARLDGEIFGAFNQHDVLPPKKSPKKPLLPHQFVTIVMTMVTARSNNRMIPREQLRQRIGHAALSLFREAGFDGVSVDQIVARARVSKGAFFNFFPTKADALLVYFHELDGRIDKLRSKLDPARPLPALERFFRQAETLLRAEGSLLDALSRAIWSHPTLMKADRVSAREDRRGFAEFFARAREAGTIADADPAVAADAVGDLWTGSILMWLAAGRSYSFAGAANAKLRLLFSGLRPRRKK